MLCNDLALLQSAGVSLVLVHGGGPAINQELTLRGIQWEFHEGQRITTPEMMEVIEMVLCGKINRRIVRTLNTAGVTAVGLSGTDAKVLMCKRSNPKLGCVGEIISVNSDVIHQYIQKHGNRSQNIIPVIAPVGIDEAGQPLNVNGDWAASRIAQALGIKKVIYLSDQDGILDLQGKLIPELDAGELEELIRKGVVKGGMLAKAKTILDAIRNNVADLHIINASRPHSLIEELFTSRGIGTVCRGRARDTAYSAN
jgi:acetylglutamate kinase